MEQEENAMASGEISGGWLEAAAHRQDRLAQRFANSFWGWLLAAAFCWWFEAGWWVALPVVLAIGAAVQSVLCTRKAMRYRGEV
jgi:hypothetical protein